MGQFLAFMLGWDLVLEYTVAGSSDKAAGAQGEVWAAQQGSDNESATPHCNSLVFPILLTYQVLRLHRAGHSISTNFWDSSAREFRPSFQPVSFPQQS